MSEQTPKFQADESSIYMMNATSNMQNALYLEEYATAQAALQSANILQELGRDELLDLQDVYNGHGFTLYYNSGYHVTGYQSGYSQYSQPTHGQSNTMGEQKTIYVYSPGYRTKTKHSQTHNEETQSDAQLVQTYFELPQNGLQSFEQMAQSMLSQATQNSTAMTSFANGISGGADYVANLLAGSLG